MKMGITITKTDVLTELMVVIKGAPDKVVKTLAETFKDDVDTTFNEEGPDWPELSEWRKNERDDDGHPILIDTGNLFNSIEVREIGDAKYSVGTDVPYATLHEFGGENELGHMVPERSFMSKTLIKNESKYNQLVQDETSRLINEAL